MSQHDPQPEAGPSTQPTSDLPSSSSAAPSASTSSSSRKARKQPAKGVSLGLEEEVDFGSDEDLMENVGEIEVPVSNTWYPGKPDSPPKGKKGKNLPTIGESTVYTSKSSLATSSSTSSKPRSGFLGRRDKTRGLDDARIVMSEDFVSISPSSSDLGMTGRISREPSENSASTGSLRVGMKKDKNRSKVFGKLFGKKRDDEIASSAGGRSLASDSVESFGSASRYSEASAPRSILVTSAHVPPTHTPKSQASSDVPSTGLPSIPTTPFSFDSRSLPSHRHVAHTKQTSGSSNTPLIHATGQPVDDFDAKESLDSDEYTPPVGAANVTQSLVLPPTIPDEPRSRTQSDTLPQIYASDYADPDRQPAHPPSAFSRSHLALSQTSDRLAQPPANQLSNLLIPPFPTTEAALDTTTILTATVMRRMPVAHPSPDRRGKAFRPGTGSSIATSFGAPRKAIWQTHQLVLTSFRVNEASPQTSPDPNRTEGERAHHRQASTQTIAHLHLFAYNNPPKATPPRPGSSAAAGKKRLGSLEGAVKVEVDRQVIGPTTIAGVWETSDEAESDTLGRKWILRVRLSEDQEEWLCDMPTGDTLFEWVRQIKAYATVIKAETLGFGAAIRSAHSMGTSDLNLELEMHEQGLKATPKPLHSTSLPNIAGHNAIVSPDFAEDLTTPNAADAYRAAMIAQGHAYDSPSAQPPISMHDFLTRKSLSPRGQDLASFLDHADLEWRMKQAEKIRENRMQSQPQSVAERGTGLGIVGARRSPPIMPPPSAILPPVPPPTGRPPAVPPPIARPPAVPPPFSSLPPVPPPSMPLPAVPQAIRGSSLKISVDDPTSPISPTTLVGASGQIRPLAVGLDEEYNAAPDFTKGSRSNTSGGFYTPAEDIAGMKQLSLGAGASKFDDTDELQPPRPLGRVLTSENLAGGYAGDDTASISSRGSSARARRGGKKPQVAMDLMAELSGRPEMNYEKPAELKEGTTAIDENRPRKIRFG